ncbi:RTA1 like protein [Trametes versicolor FP-101664 SS1]|uniref:RTA1 like protein n=1 Tax=Trametes versicolor (strain FP-101664) TaxID=717944 RepID=UPI000462417B|nr:RTA1 like protein [Trametes versicolor FP-101664 SS1]EIW64631.1 RTA1 like protein [Trametes versicolor FP-101664 SS1]
MSSTGTGVDLHPNLYGYVPTKSVCATFVVLFGVSTVLHTWQAYRSREWWLVWTVLIAGVAEVGGWVARTLSANDPTSLIPFIVQAIVLVLAPTPLVAALFMGFGRVAERLGPEYSRLSPRMYSRIFLTCDLIALNIQGGGGGLTANPKLSPSIVRIGSYIVLGGLIFQLIAMSIFIHLVAEYVWRRAADCPFRKPGTPGNEEDAHRVLTREMKLLITGICISTVFVYLRSVYRVIEFANGSNGPIIHTQVLFNVFDGAMITLGMFALNFMHPGMLLKSTAADAGFELTEQPPHAVAT